MSAVKKPKYTPGESNLEQETKRFNKRALIGSFIIHLFFFLIQFPELHLDAKLKEDPKLIPITMTMVTPPVKNKVVVNKVVADKSEVVKPRPEEKVKNGTDRVVKNSTAVGDKNQKKVQDVQKGDPASRKKEAYKPGTDVRKAPKTTVGSGSAASKVKAVDNNTGGNGDTYNGVDMTNVTDSIRKNGAGLKRVGDKSRPDDGGAGHGSGGGIGNGVGGGGGDGFITGSPNGTPNPTKVATNVGSLAGSAKGKIDSSRGFDGLASKGTISMAGVPVEHKTISTIDPDAIRRALRDALPQFRSCYQNELEKANVAEGFQGIVLLNFQIGGGGSVKRSAITSEEIKSDKVRDCMKNVLQGIQFPAPGGTRTVEVNQPIYLYPKRM
ncbi:MAG: AgmX/PglI C-terminal domain-containing protein [Bacteriovorax sp.]|nr:AgmX/PglI C-terminal domain-containing protein [Bacteriovorax sp.]